MSLMRDENVKRRIRKCSAPSVTAADLTLIDSRSSRRHNGGSTGESVSVHIEYVESFGSLDLLELSEKLELPRDLGNLGLGFLSHLSTSN